LLSSPATCSCIFPQWLFAIHYRVTYSF
jgi:hypothetical protein